MTPTKSKHHRDKDNLGLPLLPGGKNLLPEDIERLINLGQGSEIAEEMRVKKTGRGRLQILS